MKLCKLHLEKQHKKEKERGRSQTRGSPSGKHRSRQHNRRFENLEMSGAAQDDRSIAGSSQPLKGSTKGEPLEKETLPRHPTTGTVADEGVTSSELERQPHRRRRRRHRSPSLGPVPKYSFKKGFISHVKDCIEYEKAAREKDRHHQERKERHARRRERHARRAARDNGNHGPPGGNISGSGSLRGSLPHAAGSAREAVVYEQTPHSDWVENQEAAQEEEPEEWERSEPGDDGYQNVYQQHVPSERDCSTAAYGQESGEGQPLQVNEWVENQGHAPLGT